MKLLKTMLRAFILGIGLGILLAPRAGNETRRLLSQKFDQLLDGVNDLTDKLDRPAGDTSSPSYSSGESYSGATSSEEATLDPLQM